MILDICKKFERCEMPIMTMALEVALCQAADLMVRYSTTGAEQLELKGRAEDPGRRIWWQGSLQRAGQLELELGRRVEDACRR